MACSGTALPLTFCWGQQYSRIVDRREPSATSSADVLSGSVYLRITGVLVDSREQLTTLQCRLEIHHWIYTIRTEAGNMRNWRLIIWMFWIFQAITAVQYCCGSWIRVMAHCRCKLYCRRFGDPYCIHLKAEDDGDNKISETSAIQPTPIRCHQPGTESTVCYRKVVLSFCLAVFCCNYILAFHILKCHSVLVGPQP
jgi:hypothetical protein